MRKPNKTITSPKPDVVIFAVSKYRQNIAPMPMARLRQEMVAEMAFLVNATQSDTWQQEDQIELTPPRTPDTIPNPSCQPMPGPMLNLNPISPFSATMIMATPIEIVKSAVGYDAIKSEVIKMLTRMAAPKIQ